MEIKKAFEQMKKELKKELGISGGFTMSAKQIKNRTATYLICNTISFESEIASVKARDERVQQLRTWTAEQKARTHEESLETIAQLERGLAKYGTKENEARMVAEKITNSKAFERFCKEVGTVTWEIEEMDIFFYIRFNY